MAKLLVSDKELIRNKFVQKAGKKACEFKSWKTKPETELLVLSTISTQKSNYKTTSRKPIRF